MVMKKSMSGNSSNSTRKADDGRTRIRAVKRKAVTRSPAQPSVAFGPVATIDTAPVAIGNTVSGSEPIVTNVRDGVRIRGRDFFINLDTVQAGLSNWYMVGGAPLVPHALTSSLLKSYAGIYSQFMVHGMAFHFITAVGTGTQGDIAMMINKNLADPILPTTNTNFLSVLLSDKNAVLGPLWRNHTAVFYPPPFIYNTDILNDEDLEHRGPGELIVFTKSSVEQTPGYVLMDYDITFKNMQVNVRALTFPLSKMKYYHSAIFVSSLAVTTGNLAGVVWGGALPSGATAVPPLGVVKGDIYKVVVSAGTEFGTFTNVSLATLLAIPLIQGNGTVTVDPFVIQEGTTMYCVATTTGGFVLYPTYGAARTQSNPFHFGVSATIGVNLPAFFSFVGSVGESVYSQSNI